MITIILVMYCTWSDFSPHSADKCAPTRSQCVEIAKKKKNKSDCVHWLS